MSYRRVKKRNYSEIELPSNKKFGFFFTFIFTLAAAYFYNTENITWAYVFMIVTLIFLAITLVKSDALLPMIIGESKTPPNPSSKEDIILNEEKMEKAASEEERTEIAKNE